MKLLSGSSNPQLTHLLAEHFSLPLVETELTTFPNGEQRIWIKEHLAGEDVVIVQSLSAPTDQHILELLLLIDAVERLGAREVHVIIPWLGYSLQDKVFREGEPIAAKVIANLISSAFVRRVYLLDVHNTSIPGFFSVPTIHVSALQIFADYVKQQFSAENLIVASPDFGGLKRARQFATALNLDLVNIDKHRDLNSGAIASTILHGDVQEKTVLVFDDTIQSGGTVVEAADTLKSEGAKRVVFLATHGPMIQSAFEKLQSSDADEIIISNSIYPNTSQIAKLTTIDIAPIFAQALEEWF